MGGEFSRGQRPAWRWLLRGQGWRLGGAVAMAVLAAGVELLPFVLLAQAVNLVLQEPAPSASLLELAGWMALCVLLKYVLYTFAYYLSHVAAYRVLFNTRRALVRHLSWAPLPWLVRLSSGELKRRLIQDVERMEQFIAHHSVECVAALLSPLWAFALLCAVDWRLALCALLPVPLALLAQGWMMRGLEGRLREYAGAVDDLDGATLEYLRNALLMKAFRQDSRSFKRMREALDRYRRLIGRMIALSVPGWSAFTVLLGANVAILFPLGLWLHARGEVGLSDLVLVLILGTGMLRPLLRVARFNSQIQEIIGGVRRFAPLLQWPQPAEGNEQVPQGALEVRFEAVCFSYDGRPVLREIDLCLPAGQMTALVGPSGSGKSTLAWLLGGLLDADSGRVTVGGRPLAAMSDATRAATVGVVSQEAFVFRGSVLDNLLIGRPDASEEQLFTALRVAQAEDFVRALPQGLHTPLDERGVRLSGGERQRIGLARALLAETPVLVLDEATAFADSRTEQRFYRDLRQAWPEQTVLVIAHRLGSVRDAEQIVVLERGVLSDRGQHPQLLERSPLYAQQWRRQFETEQWSIRNRSPQHAVAD
ncbi:sulfate-transporting ATPase/ATP-binding cassette, subfamily B [Pseudomonas delhiensis]|uniref:Sulfate-transporting ATPase/ATP-binding cassette, subfamily B n=2 Tax=Pseudomonas delhiensis TaxID=366289 RepID=A0A239I8R9_9PSED|nr:sulfate-transporting ATPase/ATP-binding cassette, subfamily B [Pseudomonas delhiensis]SNS89957.1 sulfate-transporting ATPase/ATP-binding cassette, subfamily B [Pseudomonas delhiensis]